MSGSWMAMGKPQVFAGPDAPPAGVEAAGKADRIAARASRRGSFMACSSATVTWLMGWSPRRGRRFKEVCGSMGVPPRRLETRSHQETKVRAGRCVCGSTNETEADGRRARAHAGDGSCPGDRTNRWDHGTVPGAAAERAAARGNL